MRRRMLGAVNSGGAVAVTIGPGAARNLLKRTLLLLDKTYLFLLACYQGERTAREIAKAKHVSMLTTTH